MKFIGEMAANYYHALDRVFFLPYTGGYPPGQGVDWNGDKGENELADGQALIPRGKRAYCPDKCLRTICLQRNCCLSPLSSFSFFFFVFSLLRVTNSVAVLWGVCSLLGNALFLCGLYTDSVFLFFPLFHWSPRKCIISSISLVYCI